MMMMKMTRAGVLLLTVSAASAALPVAEIKRDTPVDFTKEIYPLLKRNCLACHNATKAKADLNLESPEAILKGGGGGPSAVPGKGAESSLFKFAAHMDDEAMPPPDNKVNAVDLTPEELGLLKLWIDQGAKGSAAAADAQIVWRGFPAQTAPVSAAAVSPGGTVAAAARGNQVALFDVRTGTTLGLLSDPELAKQETWKGQPVADRDAVMAAAFGSDDLMATGGYRTVRLWRRQAWRTARESAPLPAPPLCLTATGPWAAAGGDQGGVRLWNTADDKIPLVEMKDNPSPVKALAVTGDGATVLSAAADKSLSAWCVAEKKVAFRMELPAAATAMVLLKNETMLAVAGEDGVLRVFPFAKEIPAEALKPAGEFPLMDKTLAVLTAVDAAGTQVLWGRGDGTLQVFDIAAGKAVRDIKCESVSVRAMPGMQRRVQAAQRHADSRKARAAAATEAATKENESVKTSHEAMEKARAGWQTRLETVRTTADALRTKPDDDGRKKAAGDAVKDAADTERAFINARTNAELSIRLAARAFQAKLAAEGALTAADAALKECKARSEEMNKAAAAPFPAVKSAAVLPGARMVLLVLDGSRVQWHSLETGAFCDAAETTALPMVAATGNGVLSVRPDHRTVLLPALRPWALERTIGNPGDPAIFADRITALSFSSDARLLATGGGTPSRGGEVKVWNVAGGTAALTLKDPHSDTVNAVAFSPDDSLLATAGSDRWARVFRVADGERTASFEGHSGHVLSVAWRSDGLALATGGADKSLRTWDLLDAKQLGNNTSFGKEVSAVTWLGSGDTVVSASGDASVRLNDDRLPGNAGFVFCLAADFTGSVVAAGGQDGVLRLWNAAEKKLLAEFGEKRPVP